nr:hypothetical protein [uncultured Oscillibacter sp.]
MQEQGFVKVLAGVFLTLSLALAAALAVWEIREGNIGVSGLLLGGMFLLGALWLMADAYVRRIHVDGERICYTSSLGRKRTFTAAEIGSVKLTADIHKPYDREERLLLRWESNMKNAPYFIWFLTDHNVSIRR